MGTKSLRDVTVFPIADGTLARRPLALWPRRSKGTRAQPPPVPPRLGVCVCVGGGGGDIRRLVRFPGRLGGGVSRRVVLRHLFGRGATRAP